MKEKKSRTISLFLCICTLSDLNYGSKIPLKYQVKLDLYLSTDLWYIFPAEIPSPPFGHLYHRNKNHDTKENITDHNDYIHQNVLKT